MAKYAHITSRPEVAVGDRALALCGKDFKVKVLWDDIPPDKPICRVCVDVALQAMTEADSLLQGARVVADILELRITTLQSRLHPADLWLDAIAEDADEFAATQALALEAKAASEKAKTTCTCTWTDTETFTEDPDCPIHGRRDEAKDDRPPVAPDANESEKEGDRL